MISKNEKIARESSYEKNESFKKEGHELHMIRIVLHKICVEAAGDKWSRRHKCPVKLFDKKTEELISSAVDLSNWATIENYDPLEGFDF